MAEPLHICVMAGEPSGDFLGGQIMRALKAKAPGGDIRFSGIGGPLMAQEGLTSLYSINDLAVMGIAEVLPRLPRIIKRIGQAAGHVIKTQPDILLTIDSPDFSFRVARKIREAGGRKPLMVHCVAPTVWAWRPERAAKVARLYDTMLCLFPFEPPYFEKEGMRAAFIGHPMLEKAETGNADAFRKVHNIPTDTTVMGLLFGSRVGELNRVGPTLREAALTLARKHNEIHIVAPTLPHLVPLVGNLLHQFPCKTHILSSPAEKWDAFKAMDLALATSGTVGLELAVAGVPHAIAYKVNYLTWRMVRNKLTIKYAHLASILLDRQVVPEFIQLDCRAPVIAEAAETLLTRKDVREAQKMTFIEARGLLKGSSKSSPSEQGAAFILGLLD